MLKRLLAPSVLPLAVGAALCLAACGDDSSSSPSTPPGTQEPTPIVPDPSNPTPTPGGTEEPIPTPTPTPTPAVALGAGANAAFSANVYAAWKPYHFVNLEDEAVYYANESGEYGEVFNPNFLPAGRVVWSAQTTGYYANQCQNNESTVPGMKKRGCTVSEGIGYGMLLTYFNGDDDAYVRLWNYSRAFREYYNLSLTPWITYSFMYNQIDNSSATDADLDIATSLILQYYKTGNDAFRNDALVIVNGIWEMEVNKTTLLLYSGDTETWVNADPTYNLSYFSPVALRLFAMVDPNHNWAGVLDAMYAYIAQVQAAGTGVLPDWSNSAGVAVDPGNGSATKTYWTFNKESVRIPWRIAWDYYWNQDPRALAILTKLNNFIVEKSGGDPGSNALATNYSWDPNKADAAGGSAVPSQWLAAWCATGVGTNAAWLNACTDLVNAKVPTNNGSSYFPDILLGLYSGLLNGAYVRPY